MDFAITYNSEEKKGIFLKGKLLISVFYFNLSIKTQLLKYLLPMATSEAL